MEFPGKKAIVWPALAVGIAGALLLPWTFRSDSVRTQLARQITEATGLQTKISGRVSLSILPLPQIKVRQVGVRDPGGAIAIDADLLRGQLRFLPLLTGRFEVAKLTLERPSIAIDASVAAIAERGALARARQTRTDTPEAAAADSARLGTFVIEEGTLHLQQGGASARLFALTNINATLDWRRLRSAAALQGTAVWSGEKFRIAGLVSKPSELLRAGISPLTLAVNTRLGTIALDGNLSSSPRWQFSGALKAESESFASLMEFATPEYSLPGHFDHASLSAQARVLAGAVALTDLKLLLDKNEFAGTLTAQVVDGRPELTGTLAAADLVFAPNFNRVSRMFGSSDSWNRRTLHLSTLSMLDLDLRLSANSLRIGQVGMNDVGLAALLKQGQLEVSLASTKAFGGAFRSRFSLANGPAVPSLRAAMNFEKIRTEELFKATAQSGKLTGVASGEFDLRSGGTSIQEFVELAQGKALAELENGSIGGIDFDRALHQAQTQPLSLPSELGSGRTAFRRARFAVDVENGKAKLAEAFTESDTLKVLFSGVVALATKTLALDVNAISTKKPPVSAMGAGANSPQLQLDLTGPWARPSLIVDAESLIRNSEAAAPLLRSLSRKPGDANAPSAAAPASAQQ